MTNELAMIAEALRALTERDGVDVEIKRAGGTWRVIVYEVHDSIIYARYGEGSGERLPVAYQQALNACRSREAAL